MEKGEDETKSEETKNTKETLGLVRPMIQEENIRKSGTQSDTKPTLQNLSPFKTQLAQKILNLKKKIPK